MKISASRSGFIFLLIALLTGTTLAQETVIQSFQDLQAIRDAEEKQKGKTGKGSEPEQKPIDTGPPPILVFDEIEHDFNLQTNNSVLKHEFQFRNDGTGLLIIENVNAG